jgi:hypothetical protein
MMKFLKYFFIWLCMMMVLACIAGYVYIRLEGKGYFEQQFSKFFGQASTIESVRYLVPFGVRFHKLEIRNVIEAEDVFLHLRIPFFLDKRFIIARLELVEPIFHLVRHERTKLDFGGAYLSQQEKRFYEARQHLPTVDGVLIDFLSIENGRLDILDLAVEEPVKYAVGSINGKALKFVYPLTDQSIKFDVEGIIMNAGQQHWLKKGFLSAAGWVNWVARDMDMVLNFQGYEGIVGDADLKAKGNVVTAEGRLEFGQIQNKIAAKEVKDAGQFSSKTLAGILKETQLRLAMDFNFTTQMDAFRLGTIDFEGDLSLPQ